MSYRAFKKLLGETSLERKCRFLLGAGILILITLSFWIYARQTEYLAYGQTENTGRVLITPIIARLHLDPESLQAMDGFQNLAEMAWPEPLREYRYKILKPKASKPEHKPEGEELAIVNQFLSDPEKTEETRSVPSQNAYYFYSAIRANTSCVDCHNRHNRENKAPFIEPDDLMAVVAVRLSTKQIETGVHVNRAILISTALLTSLVIMAGSYLIIRYVIVKPVKHLKEVSDAISGGHLNVRSEIQTGDEFEDLSHAFNRMLRNLVAMQDRSQKLNADLDRKVDELAHANMALYESNRMKGDFLATMSHELRTPLNSIIGFSDVLLSSGGGGQLSEKQARWVVNIKSSGQQLLNLINEILDLAKIEAGKMEIHPEELSLPELCDTLLNMFRAIAEKKNIELRTNYSPDLVLLRQDGIKLRQIVSNLLSNAVKFTPEGGFVTVITQIDGEFFLLTIEDTGVGIAPEDQEVIFEKFRQGANPLTREQEGSGLGLSIVRELCKLLGGDISLKSELGRGSIFTVRLPIQLHVEHRMDFSLPLAQLPIPNGRLLELHRPPSSVNETPQTIPAEEKVEGREIS
jgi:two-component system, NarL family, sensor histidine kinase BarA